MYWIFFIIWLIGFLIMWAILIRSEIWNIEIIYKGKPPKYPHFWRFLTMLQIAIFWPVVLMWCLIDVFIANPHKN